MQVRIAWRDAHFDISNVQVLYTIYTNNSICARKNKVSIRDAMVSLASAAAAFSSSTIQQWYNQHHGKYSEMFARCLSILLYYRSRRASHACIINFSPLKFVDLAHISYIALVKWKCERCRNFACAIDRIHACEYCVYVWFEDKLSNRIFFLSNAYIHDINRTSFERIRKGKFHHILDI